MKGPGRHRYAVRRLWQCPICQRRELTDGDVAALQCLCLSRANPPALTWMKLLEEPRRPRPPSPAPEPAAVTATVVEPTPTVPQTAASPETPA